jgi:hypothetical protein
MPSLSNHKQADQYGSETQKDEYEQEAPKTTIRSLMLFMLCLGRTHTFKESFRFLKKEQQVVFAFSSLFCLVSHYREMIPILDRS